MQKTKVLSWFRYSPPLLHSRAYKVTLKKQDKAGLMTSEGFGKLSLFDQDSNSRSKIEKENIERKEKSSILGSSHGPRACKKKPLPLRYASILDII